MGISYEGGGGGGPVNVDVPFVAGDFFATGAMTWTVEAADLQTFSYSLDGKILTLTFTINTTTIGGVVAGNNLQMKLPGGMLAAKKAVMSCLASPGGGALESVAITTTIGSNVLTILRYAANWIAGANNTGVSGVFICQVQ